MLEEVAGFRRVEAGEPVNPAGQYYCVYAYDWRLDDVESVRG